MNICRRVATFLVVVWLLAAGIAAAQTGLKTRNVVVIVSDGLRWQEVFHGPDPALMDKKNGRVEDLPTLQREFARQSAAEGRRAIFPFLWDVIAKQGQIFGNQTAGSPALLTNGLKFSYPGYNEMLTGAGDRRIDKNDFGPNPNVTVFEWLNGQPEFHGRTVAFATWGVFNDIFNAKRSGVFLYAGWAPPAVASPSPRQAMLEQLYGTTTRLWSDNAYDSFMHAALVEYLHQNKPRVLFVGYGETDEWAHEGRYDLYLRSAHQFDAFVAELWKTMQAMPEYRGTTTFILTTDHGRGRGLRDWRDHGEKIRGAEQVWIAVIGPDTPPLGEQTSGASVTQSQIAATVAALLGRDFRAAAPAAAPPISAVIAPPR